MSNTNHLNHSTWECKYHLVFTPKYRKKLLFSQIRKDLKSVFHRLAAQKECKIEEGHLLIDRMRPRKHLFYLLKHNDKLKRLSSSHCNGLLS